MLVEAFDGFEKAWFDMFDNWRWAIYVIDVWVRLTNSKKSKIGVEVDGNTMALGSGGNVQKRIPWLSLNCQDLLVRAFGGSAWSTLPVIQPYGMITLSSREQSNF